MYNYTGKSFVEFVKYLFSLPEVKANKLAFLSNHLCQDPLENFFGCQRQMGGTNDNPTVQEYYQNTESLCVINSFCRGSVRVDVLVHQWKQLYLRVTLHHFPKGKKDHLCSSV